MNRPVVPSEGRGGAQPLKLGGYLNTAEISEPSENTTLVLSSSIQNEKDLEEWRHDIPKMNLGKSLSENLPVKVNIPSENTTLFLPSSVQNREDTEEWRHDIPKVNLSENVMENITKKVNIPSENTTYSVQNRKDLQEQQHDILSENVTENVPVNTYKHSAGVNITTNIISASNHSLQIGDKVESIGDDDGSGGVSLPPGEAMTERGTTRGSHVIWGSEDGLVHMGMRPRPRPIPRPVNRPRQPLRVEATEPPAHETTDLTSTHTPELSPFVPGVWTTDTPVEMLRGVEGLTGEENVDTEDQVGTSTPEEVEMTTGDLTETPVEMLTGVEGLTSGDNMDTEDQVGTSTPEDMEMSTGANDVTFLPEEHVTVSPEEWLSSTLQDDWLTFMEIDTQDHSTSPISTHLPLSPSLTSSLSSSLTPTLPPSLPPTPSPQDAIEDSFRITTRGLDFLLEASPTGQTPDTIELPKDDLFTLDLTITTTREGLKVEARDVTLDPSQIAKATSYEGSSYPTATRSATVTTTWVDEEQPTSPRVDEEKASSGNDATETSDLKPADWDMPAFPMDLIDSDSEATETHEVDGVTITYSSTTERSNTETTPIALQTSPEDEIKKEYMTENPTHTRYKTQYSSIKEEDMTENPTLTRYETQNSARSLSFPVVANVTETRNESITKGSETQVETVMYEIPVVTRNGGPQLSASVVVALSVCCAVVLVLAALSVALWVCRRHRNRSKIYLSREAAKPRAFFTRPMNPAVLPEDSDREDAVYMLEFQRPRPPILLGDDHKGIYFIKREEGAEECRASLGVENEAFSDVPLGEADEAQTRLDPPKYELRSKQDSDADSGIRVWSSTGSLHAAASPLPAHCRVPPPPYSPSISKESVCLTVHSLPSLPRNSQLFDV
ncbi:mucin-2-like [Scylla paramamosain]|uniref:mucin-2-like n=1 Tax=Scylla paramamosain TaxID=85552 RepID=UPI0030835B2B